MPGYNPLGNDNGPSPPRPRGPGLEAYWPAGYLLPQQNAMYQSPPAAPMPQYYWPTYYSTYPTYQTAWGWPPRQPSNPPPPPPPPASITIRHHPAPVNTITPQPNRQSTSGRPKNDDGMPGLNLQNWQGGIGNPPGWNYMFGRGKNAPIVFIRSGGVRPWTNEFVNHAANPKNMISLEPTTVRENMTVLELLDGAGANNADPKKNVVVEVVSQGNGRWKRGMTIHGGDERAKKTIKELGWDHTRTGELPHHEFTYLYVTGDTLYSAL